MSTTSLPRVSISLLAAQLASTVKGRTDLICGALISGATAVSEQLYTDVATLSKTQLDTLFGADSDLRNRISQVIDSNGGYSQIDVQGITETGSASAGDITFGTGVGTATEDGEIIVSPVDKYQFSKVVTVTTGDTDQDVVTAIISAINSFANIPITAVVDGVNDFEIDITANDKGTVGNFYKVELDGVIAGLGAIVINQLSAGATNPTLTTFFDNLESSRFTGINWPTAWASDVAIVKAFLDARFNTSNAILDGVAFNGIHGTFATVKALVDAQNSQSLVFGGNKQLTAGGGVAYFKPADWDMAYFQGIRSRRLTPDAPVAEFITTTAGPLDAFGGPAHASLPYFNTPMKQTEVTDPNDMYSSQEQVELEDAGFSVIGVNSAGNGMITGPMVTTYTTDNAGNPNDSFHYLNYVDTSSVCREYIFNNLKTRFSQSRLTNGTLVPNRSMENQESIRAEFLKEYIDLSNLALTVKGADAQKFFLKNLILVLDLANRKVTATFQLPIVTQLGEFIATAQLNFNFKES